MTTRRQLDAAAKPTTAISDERPEANAFALLDEEAKDFGAEAVTGDPTELAVPPEVADKGLEAGIGEPAKESWADEVEEEEARTAQQPRESPFPNDAGGSACPGSAAEMQVSRLRSQNRRTVRGPPWVVPRPHRSVRRTRLLFGGVLAVDRLEAGRQTPATLRPVSARMRSEVDNTTTRSHSRRESSATCRARGVAVPPDPGRWLSPPTCRLLRLQDCW
jgi:hypothetical protein